VALVYPCKHPLILAKLAALRSKETRPPEFRRLVRALAALVTYEAAADLPTKDITVTTPLGPAPGKAIADPVLIVPILRAGLGMADGVLDLIPDAEVWHIGLKRDEKTLLPDEYYRKLPDHAREAIVFIVDPMLATGGSAVHACELIKMFKPPRIKFLALIAAPEGIERLTSAMPDVSIHIGVIDERLNERGFIHPGLGDAGDRLFATFER
jgi:uracil phosphoribosyltransferase